MTSLDQRIHTLRGLPRNRREAGRGLGDIALMRTAENPDRIVVSQGGRHVTCHEMLDMALCLGGALMARGIAPGAAIAFQLPNWWEAAVINLAAALFGYRIVPLLTIYRSAELGVILPACDVAAVFVPPVYRRTNFPALIGSLPAPPKHVFIVRGKAEDENSFEQMLRVSPAGLHLPPPGDAKLVMFTSGSTGRPKGVIHSHATLDALIRRTAEFWGTGADDVFYVPSPIGHIGGSIYAFEFPWITGCRTILAEHWDADEAVREIASEGATFMAGATPFLSGLLAAAEKADTSLPSLRRFVCGGASVQPELVRAGLAAFPNAVVSRAYGSTEIPLVCPGARNRDEAEAHADTDGECTSRLRILDDEGREVAEGETGEIAVAAPQLFLGYLEPEDDLAAFTEDDLFLMGDLGRVVGGRYLEITGRKKDIIIRKGENISPLEIENALARHPSVRQSSIVGAPDPERGEMLVAFVVVNAGMAFSMHDMCDHLDALGLARQKFPERLELMAALPMNSVGKVQKPELRILAAQLVGRSP